MLIDHIGFIFFPQFIIFRIIGRLAFPLFAWGIASGYTRTKDFSKYLQRILLLALISQPIFYLTISQEYLNICFSLFLGLLSIYFYDHIKKNKLNILWLMLSISLAYLLNVEYGIYGIFLILFFFIFRKSFYMVPAQSFFTFVYSVLFPKSFLQIFSFPAFFIIYYFHKYDFRINRIFQYSFYPGHLLILYLIKNIDIFI